MTSHSLTQKCILLTSHLWKGEVCHKAEQNLVIKQIKNKIVLFLEYSYQPNTELNLYNQEQ